MGSNFIYYFFVAWAAELDFTTLDERRVRGYLIETFKIVNNVVDYGHDIFVLGRSGRNIVSCGLKVCCFRKKFSQKG